MPTPLFPGQITASVEPAWLNAALAAAEQRDPKGSYRKARRGERSNFHRIDPPYEGPDNPELRIDHDRVEA